jgi:4-hydroxy-3-methylbut-2-enyl diphosphate reductase
MEVSKVLLASPRGFCAGVDMATQALDWMVSVFEPPVYCYHEIVHNAEIVKGFQARGVVFVDDVSDVPAGSPLMLSAHGTAPEVITQARSQGCLVVNAVCPLVTKVHHELKVRASKGYRILYVGHAGHEEAIGTMAEAPEQVTLIERPEDLEGLDPQGQELALLTQTTLAMEERDAVLEAARQRFGEVWTPGKSDLCFATTNRQRALAEIASRSDSVVVLGSANSSNTIALTKVATRAGAKRVMRIDGAEELPDDLRGVVGVTAGASAPETILQEVLERLEPANGVEEVRVLEEDEYFPPPRELRALAEGLAGLTGAALGVRQ